MTPPVVSQGHPYSCHQRVVAACSEHLATVPTKLHSRAQPQAGRPFSRLLCPVRVPRDQHVIVRMCVWGGAGVLDLKRAGWSLEEAGRVEIPRNAFSFFESAIFCQNKGQECVPVRSPTGPS